MQRAQIIEPFLDFIFPKICTRCGEEGHYLCFPKNLQGIVEYYLPKEKGKKRYLHALFAAVSYKEEWIDEAIYHLKYDSVKEIASIIGRYIAKIHKKRLIKDSILVPVPLHRLRYNWRGFNQAEEIARSIYDCTKIPFCSALVRHKSTTPQIALDKKARLENIGSSFSKGPDIHLIRDKVVYIVDDVATTGATLESCARVLLQNGAKKVISLVGARD